MYSYIVINFLQIFIYGLDLIGLSFSKHLTMNMALLTDQYEEDFLENTITLIQEKVYDKDWEVRRSTIEVIAMISKNVSSKYLVIAIRLIELILCKTMIKMLIQDLMLVKCIICQTD